MQVTSANIFRNFLAFFLVLFFNVPASASLEAVAELENTPVFLNEPVVLVVTVSWRGEQGDYRVGVPKIDLPEGIVRTGVSSQSLRVDDMFRIVYTCRLEVRQCGEFSINTVEVDYLIKDSDETFTKRISGPSFVVGNKPLWSGPTVWLVLAVIGVLLAIVICLIVVWSKGCRNRTTNDHAPLNDEERQAWNERLEHCRKLKAQGEVRLFFDEAVQLQQAVDKRLPGAGETETIHKRFAALVDEVKYGGVKPHSSKVEAYFRALEQMIHDVSNR